MREMTEIVFLGRTKCWHLDKEFDRSGEFDLYCKLLGCEIEGRNGPQNTRGDDRVYLTWATSMKHMKELAKLFDCRIIN